MLFVAQGTFCLWLLLTLNFSLGLALDKKYPSKKTKKRRKKGMNFAGLSRFKLQYMDFKGINWKIFYFREVCILDVYLSKVFVVVNLRELYILEQCTLERCPSLKRWPSMNYASVLERFLCLRDLSLDLRKLSDLESNLPYESWLP